MQLEAKQIIEIVMNNIEKNWPNPEKSGPNKNENPAQENSQDNSEKLRQSIEELEQLIEKIRQYYQLDIHVHSLESNRGDQPDGKDESGVLHRDRRLLAYAQLLGLEGICFAEHSSNPGQPTLLSAEHPICQKLLASVKRIKALNESGKYKAKAYAGVEANIFFTPEGKPAVDVPAEVLKEMDLVIASRHAIDNQRDPEAIRQSFLAAINTKEVDIIGHPYRHIEFYPHDFNYFLKWSRDNDPETYQALQKMKEEEDWDSVKEVIGKKEPTRALTQELAQKFKRLEQKYWQVWDEILDAMEEKGKVFEINLSSFTPTKSFYQILLKRASSRPNLKFSIVFDFHNLAHLQKIKSKDLRTSRPEKVKNLARAKAIQKLSDLIDLLKEYNIGPERIINSSTQNFFAFIEERKKEKE